MKRRFTSIIGGLLLILNVSGQSILHHPEAWYAPAPGADKYFHDSINDRGQDLSSLPLIRYNINIGTSFTAGGFYGDMFQTWVAPEIQFPVSDRLSIRAGVVVGHVHASNMGFMPNGIENQGNTANWMTYTLYAEGTYKISNDLTMTGTVFKKIDQTPAWVNQSVYNQDFESYSLSFHYRLSNSMHIGANIRIDRGANPSIYQPYSPYGRPPPLGWEPWR